jgi:hypothetical protein
MFHRKGARARTSRTCTSSTRRRERQCFGLIGATPRIWGTRSSLGLNRWDENRSGWAGFVTIDFPLATGRSRGWEFLRSERTNTLHYAHVVSSRATVIDQSAFNTNRRQSTPDLGSGTEAIRLNDCAGDYRADTFGCPRTIGRRERFAKGAAVIATLRGNDGRNLRTDRGRH